MNPERERIAALIQAVIGAYGPYDESVQEDVWARAEYRLRAGPLLDELDIPARPFPDLQAMLSAARLELNL